MQRKIYIIYITSLLVILSFTGLQAQTIIDQGTCGDSLTWVLTSDSTLTINGSGAMDDYTGGTAPWYSSPYQNTIKTVVIDSGVTSIGDYAFWDCRTLTSISIPISIVTIGDYALRDCWSLIFVNIPNSVITIGDYAFYWCTGLTSVTISNSVTTIGNYAFYFCIHLNSLTISDSVTTIGDYAFWSCLALTSVTMPNTVTTIGGFAFCNSGLASINIPSSVTAIGVGAFSECSSLISINVDVNNLFYSSIDSVLYNKLQDTLIQCPIRKTVINIPNTVTTIGDYAFAYWMSYSFPIIPNSVITIGNYAFRGCHFTSTSIPNSVTTIGNYAFGGCLSLISLVIPNSVTTIDHHAFMGCFSLTSLTIPNSVTIIGDSAFYFCMDLNSIVCEAVTPPDIHENTFLYVSPSIPVSVPCSSFNSYETADYWNAFTNFRGMDDTVFIFDTICQGVIYNDNGFTINDTAGIYYRTQATANNCKSVMCLTLSMYPLVSISHYSATICQGNVYSDSNFTNLTQAGDYYDTLQNVNGCDSIIRLTLTKHPQSLVTYYSATICQGDIYSDDHFTNLTRIDVYYDTLQNVNGCDSVICLMLSTYPLVSVTHYSATICQGDIYSDDHFTHLTQAGVYYDTLKNINGCDSIIELTLIVNPLPNVPAISRNEHDLTSSEANSYQWYLDNQPIIGAAQQNYIYTQNGIYFVEVTNEYGCKIKSDSINITDVWIADISKENSSIVVYPNPTNGQLTIENGQLEIENIEIFDVLCRNVYSSTHPIVHSSTIIIDISHLPTGMYYLKISGKENVTKKIIKN